ncbi:MAG: transporter substrate-binding domain-containing protein, partial [Anaerovoracaceae bacterium]
YGVIYSTLAVKDSNLEVNESNYMNIDGLRLGLTTKASSRNENAQKFLTEQGVNFEPVYADSFAGLVALLNAGEVDVIPDVTINGIQGTRHIGQFSPTPFYFASGKGNTQLMASLDDAIKQLNMADPYFQYDLTQKYFGDNMDDFFITPQEKAYLKEKDTLKVLYIPDCAPFIVEDNHGKLTGISVLLMDNFAKAAGLTVEYVRYDSSKDFSKEFSQGGYDCIIGLPINASYNAKLGIVTSNPYMTSSTLSFSRPNQVSSVAEAESVALLRGSELAQLFPDKEILYYDTTEECISAVVRGKADVGCGNQYSLEYYAHKSFVNLNMVPLTDQEKNMEISVSRDNASTLLPILNRYILNLNDNDIYAYHTDVTTVTEVSWLKGLILASPLRTIIVSLCLVFIVVSSILLFFFWRLSRRENAALNSANNAKSEFLSRVSHDMRTPMNAIISFSDPQIEKS